MVMDTQTIEILAIPGSLRRSSINRAALQAADVHEGTANGILITIDSLVRTLPHFHPDLELDPPEAVVRFRDACERRRGSRDGSP
jgi:NAD(P)H-dependent FMN reductase